MDLNLEQIIHIFRGIVREEVQALKVPPQDDFLISVEEAAAILTVSEEWIYKYKNNLPFVVKPQPNMVRVSHHKLQHYIAKKSREQERGNGAKS